MANLQRSPEGAAFAQQIARALLQIGALRFRPEHPFTWSSGLRAPLYCDNRLVLSYPEVRNLIRQAFLHQIQTTYPQAQALCGVATGAIAIGMLVADTMNLPYLYVRPKAKGHGLGNQVEGRAEAGAKLVVIEDLVSTGGSSLEAIAAVRKEDYQVLGLVSIFTYGFHTSAKAFKDAAVELHPLCDLDVLLQIATEDKLLVSSVIDSIKSWQQDPQAWNPL